MPMNSMSTSEPTPQQERLLDLALQQALATPPLPDGFRAGLMSAVLQQALVDVASRKRALELEHAQSLQQLRRGHVRLQRDTLALLLLIAFTAGACTHLALPWLHSVLGIEPSAAMPALALVIGLAASASVWLDRFARTGLLTGAGRD